MDLVHVLEIGTFEFLSICVPATLCAFMPDHKHLNCCFRTLSKSDKCLPLLPPASPPIIQYDRVQTHGLSVYLSSEATKSSIHVFIKCYAIYKAYDITKVVL